jgi:hypothetical protein
MQSSMPPLLVDVLVDVEVDVDVLVEVEVLVDVVDEEDVMPPVPVVVPVVAVVVSLLPQPTADAMPIPTTPEIKNALMRFIEVNFAFRGRERKLRALIRRLFARFTPFAQATLGVRIPPRHRATVRRTFSIPALRTRFTSRSKSPNFDRESSFAPRGRSNRHQVVIGRTHG